MNSNERSTSRNRSGKPKNGNSISSGNRRSRKPNAPGEKLHKARVSKFERILDKAPAMFSAAQLRVVLRALVSIDRYAFDDVAEHLTANDENNQQTSEEILLAIANVNG
jgi:hypothetical protein